MKRLIFVFVAVAFSFSCSADDWALGYDQSLLSPEKEEYRTAFLAYGMALIVWHRENPKSKKPFKFSREYEARESMIDIWLELKKKGEVPDSKYLSELGLVYESGYLKEYVWYYHKNKKWRKPRKLKLEEFMDFMVKNLPEHEPNEISEINVSNS